MFTRIFREPVRRIQEQTIGGQHATPQQPPSRIGIGGREQGTEFDELTGWRTVIRQWRQAMAMDARGAYGNPMIFKTSIQQTKVESEARKDPVARRRFSNPKNRHTNRRASTHVRQMVAGGKRSRGYICQSNSYVPPEDWHEPSESNSASYRIVVQNAGVGYRHVVTAAEVRERLSQLPAEFLRPLHVVQFSKMTRKKNAFPCYGMQWGNAIYLYPLETELVEFYGGPPRPAEYNEARMFGGRWESLEGNAWKLIWTPQTIRDFYLNNVLIHELGHLLDNRNSSYRDRERYAEWFAIEHGYRPSRQSRRGSRQQRR